MVPTTHTTRVGFFGALFAVGGGMAGTCADFVSVVASTLTVNTT